MLELTRRMTISRNCFDRIAGAYFDEEGYIDGTFNTNFLKLSPRDKTAYLAIAKSIPFSETNVNLTGYQFEKEETTPGSIWQMLMAIRECELKNDALLDIFYDVLGERYPKGEPFAIYLFHGNYDVPLKLGTGYEKEESEEIYSFLICAVCPYQGDYEPEMPQWGFLFPAFTNRSSDISCISVYHADKENDKIAFL